MESKPLAMNRPRPIRRYRLLFLCWVILNGGYLRVGASLETSTEARQAGNIYRLQGEYRGVIDEWGGNWGAQVVATGERSLRVQLLKGGLPGDGFQGKEPEKKVDCTLIEDATECTASSDSFEIALKPGSLEVWNKEKKARESGRVDVSAFFVSIFDNVNGMTVPFRLNVPSNISLFGSKDARYSDWIDGILNTKGESGSEINSTGLPISPVAIESNRILGAFSSAYGGDL